MVVAPFTGAWIEIDGSNGVNWLFRVAPFTGAWIEIGLARAVVPACRSLPSRERGLKFQWMRTNALVHIVAPFTGAWIEILTGSPSALLILVAPFTGAWIEI